MFSLSKQPWGWWFETPSWSLWHHRNELDRNGLMSCVNRADSRFVPSRWETGLLCNDISHWLGASLESTLLEALDRRWWFLWSHQIKAKQIVCIFWGGFFLFVLFLYIALIFIWVRSRRCGCLVTWFCYQMIAKPGNKTAAPSWPDPSVFALSQMYLSWQ